MAKAELLDENCAGADGNVRESFYVASDGNDAFAGSPTRPLRTIGAAVLRASSSLGSAAPSSNGTRLRPSIGAASSSDSPGRARSASVGVRSRRDTGSRTRRASKRPGACGAL